MAIRLKVMREARGWSRAELARRANMAASDVGKIENTHLRPYAGQLRKLAMALGVHEANALGLLEVVSI